MNYYEKLARLAKAAKLSEFAAYVELTSSEMESLSEEQWASLSKSASVNAPSAKTVSVVIAMARKAEKDREKETAK